MEKQRNVKSETYETPNENDFAIQTSHRKKQKLEIQDNMEVPENKYQNSQKMIKPKQFSFEKSILCETTRIKGQQKLMYIKQCRLKMISKELLFKNYPFSDFDHFTFDSQILRDQEGALHASIVQNSKGLHLVEKYQVLSIQKNNKNSIKNPQQEENLLNGRSISIRKNGQIFEGTYRNSKAEGYCYELHPNGNTFIGQFYQDLKKGKGTFYWFTNDEMYTGEWFGDLPHGQGTHYARDRYEGQFSNGLKHGFGEDFFENGDYYAGEYTNGLAEGYGEYKWQDGSIYKGDFKHGIRHGYGIWQNQKEVYQGWYRIDKKEGFGVYTWKGKQTYKGQFRDDKRQGYGQFYQIVKNAKEKIVYKGCWKNGKREEGAKFDADTAKKLHKFLDINPLKKQQIEQSFRNQQERTEKKKERVGHRNCIPPDPFQQKFSPTAHK